MPRADADSSLLEELLRAADSPVDSDLPHEVARVASSLASSAAGLLSCGPDDVDDAGDATDAVSDGTSDDSDDGSDGSDTRMQDALGRGKRSRASVYFTTTKIRDTLDGARVAFARALSRFGTAVTRYCKEHSGEPPSVADVASFEQFCNEHAPGLFDLFADGIPHGRAGADKHARVREQTPALLLSLLYRSSQKHSAFAKRKNAVLRVSGVSDAGIAVMNALGDAVSARTQRRHALTRVAQLPSVVSSVLSGVVQPVDAQPCHVVIDDFTMTAGARAPTVAGGTSASWTFASTIARPLAGRAVRVSSLPEDVPFVCVGGDFSLSFRIPHLNSHLAACLRFSTSDVLLR